MNLSKCCDFKIGFFVVQKKKKRVKHWTLFCLSLGHNMQNTNLGKGGQGVSSHKVKFVK